MKAKKYFFLSSIALFSGCVLANPSDVKANSDQKASQSAQQKSSENKADSTAGKADPHKMPAEPKLRPEPEYGMAAYIMSKVLTSLEYEQKPLDESLSKQIFEEYFKSLDGMHMYLLQSDVDKFRKYAVDVGLMIKRSNLTFPFAMYEMYRERVKERYDYVFSLLAKDKPFDFTVHEDYNMDRKKAPWAKTSAELDDIWRRRVKNDYLRLKLVGKSDKEIVERLTRRYTNSRNQFLRLDSEHVAELFLNAYASSTDPHTNYMSPSNAKNFQVEMSLSVEGIGAVLQKRDEYGQIREVVAGGPAQKSGQLHPGDRIVAVGQGKDGPMEDVIDWRLDEIVKKIRGKRGTVVRIEVIPASAGADGQSKTVVLTRDKVLMEDQAAKLKTYEAERPDGSKQTVGIIEIPSFYEDFANSRSDKSAKTLSADMRKILQQLKDKHVSAVVLDLRNDGGGSLRQAAAVSGLFIGPGKPVVQVSDAAGKVKNVNTPEGEIFWDKPVVVMVNRFSASASEIFAAVIKDYHRGVILGDPTWGKGSVQTLAPLKEFLKNPPNDLELGSLKWTIQKFFRVNGSSTQVKGVVPDIRFPSAINAKELGESSYDNAMEWSALPEATYKPFDMINKSVISKLQSRHEQRTRNNPSWKLFKDETAFAFSRSNEKRVSLNLKQRQKEREGYEAKRKEFDSRRKALGESDVGIFKLDDGLAYGEGNLTEELADEEKRKKYVDTSAREAAQIALDLLEISGSVQQPKDAAASEKSNAADAKGNSSGAQDQPETQKSE